MIITLYRLESLIDGLIKDGRTVVGPVKESSGSAYQVINSFKQINLGLPYPTKSSKEYFLSDSEPILTFTSGQKGVELKDAPEPAGVILFGLRPCEAASYPIMDKVFAWDCNDEFYIKRREKNVIISVACEQSDRFCFCTSTGLAPDSSEGSDIILRRTIKGNYIVEVVTEKGRALVNSNKGLFSDNVSEQPVECKGPDRKFDLDMIRQWLDSNFEHPIWNKMTLPCIGCGACTFLCPTCHCFDIVDEGALNGGCRYKNWDACQFSMFTVHASGHNPRDNQSKRFRQRIQHKFNYYPGKFGRTLCVGCGRCIRHCPADMSLLDVLVSIDKLAKT
ncbi:MAG: 4Fe-4S dicluster domain-containing protein [Candidatus Brocadiia bacterium]